MENSYLKAEIAVDSADVVYFSRRPKFHHMMQFFYITLKVPYYPSYMKLCSDFPYLPYFLRKINIIGEVSFYSIKSDNSKDHDFLNEYGRYKKSEHTFI